MAFTKINFKYTPPPTVPLAGVRQTSLDRQTRPLRPKAESSRANRLIRRLIELNATALYLEQVILARTKGMGIQLNQETDFEVIAALNRIYNVDPESEQLQAVTVEMYNSLMDAEMAIVRADLEADNRPEPSENIVSPQQRMDIYRINQAFESAMVEAGEFKFQLPPLLRDLKGDRIVFEEMADGLRQYPIIDASDLYKIDPAPSTAETIGSQPNPIEYEAITEDMQAPDVELEQVAEDWRLNPDNIGTVEDNPPESGVDLPEDYSGAENLIDDPDYEDISPGLTADLEERLDLFDNYYAALYNLAANIDQIYIQMGTVINTFFYRPLNDILAIVAMLKALKTLFHLPKVKDIKGALAMFIFPRLISGLAKFNFMTDRLLNKATFPINRVLNSLGKLFAGIGTLTNQAAWVLDGGLTGTVKHAVQGRSDKIQVPSAKDLAVLEVIPDAIKTISANMNWAMNAVRDKNFQLQASLLRALERKLGTSGDRLEVLRSLRSVDAIIGVLTGLQRSVAAYTGGANQSPPSSAVQVLSGALADFRTEAGTVFSLQGDMVLAQVPDIPPPPGKVKSILTKGGAELQTSGQIQINLS